MVFMLGLGLVKTNDVFDALPGLYHFKVQRGGVLAGFKSDIVDGCVSRATGFGYGGHTQFTIVSLNQSARDADKAGYDNFMDTFVAVT